MIETDGQYQQHLFNIIIKQIGSKDKLKTLLIERLKFSDSTARRLLTSERILNFPELIELSKYFKIPLHEFFHSPDNLVSFYLENNNPTSYEEWMKTTHQNFAMVCDQPNVKMYYTSTENPIFNHFHFEELTRFKLYIWARAIWEIPEQVNEKFDLSSDLWTDKVREYREKMLADYTRIPSVEFWTPSLMNNNLSQIHFYLEAHQFANRADALLLCDQLLELMQILLKQSETGKKVPVKGVKKTGDFDVYYNSILHMNNTLFFTSDDGKALYTTLGNPTTIKTWQPKVCEHSQQWFNKLIKRCTKISQSSESVRLSICHKTIEKIERQRALFKGMV